MARRRPEGRGEERETRGAEHDRRGDERCSGEIPPSHEHEYCNGQRRDRDRRDAGDDEPPRLPPPPTPPSVHRHHPPPHRQPPPPRERPGMPPAYLPDKDQPPRRDGDDAHDRLEARETEADERLQPVHDEPQAKQQHPDVLGQLHSTLLLWMVRGPQRFARYARTSGAARRRISAFFSSSASSSGLGASRRICRLSPSCTATGTPSRKRMRLPARAATGSPGVMIPTRFSASAPHTATSSPFCRVSSPVSRLTERSSPIASRRAYCSPENPATTHPPPSP